MTATNATDFLIHLENTLGWSPNPRVGLRKGRMYAAKRLKEAMAKDPEKFTWENLELAVEHLRRKRRTVLGPLFVLLFVDEALAAAATTQHRPLGELIDAAIETEQFEQAADYEYWIGQLTRANGDARRDALDRWRVARRQPAGAGLCPVCGKSYRLKKDGTVRSHLQPPCTGSYLLPKEAA